MKKFNGRPVEILLVEDNEGDVLLTQEAFKSAKIANNIHVTMDGEQAMRYLRKEEEFSDAVTPDVILLDLNLPIKSGQEVLADIKADDHLKHLPVIIMTSSQSEQDVVQTYNLHANSYIIKPLSLEQFSQVVSALENFWFMVVVLPEEDDVEKVGLKES